MGGQDEFKAWASGEVERPRRGWVERVLWAVALLTLVAVPMMCTAEFAGPLFRF